MANYNNYSVDELIDFFLSATTNNEKTRLLQAIEIKEAAFQHRDPCDVRLKSIGADNGNYADKVININKHNSNFQQLETYFHESRHAHQDHAVQTGEGLTEELRNECAIQSPKTGAYIRPEDDFKHYLTQSSEADANFYACDRMASLCERYKANPAYAQETQKIYENKIDQYRQIDEKCQNSNAFSTDKQNVIHYNQAVDTVEYYRDKYQGKDKEQKLNESFKIQNDLERKLSTGYKPFQEQYKDTIDKVVAAKVRSHEESLRTHNQVENQIEAKQETVKRGGNRR